MKELEIREEAESDISKSYLWYEEKRMGLGGHFMLCIEESFARITRNPKQFPEVLKPIRRTFIKRFPYAIYFIDKKNSVSVIAVLHHRQSSTLLQGRT